jgi:hypothetical protein
MRPTFERADHPAGLGAHQLGRVGVALLRHDRGAGGEAVREAHEPELGRHPKHDLFGETGQVNGGDRRGRQRLKREVAVGNGIERVGHGTIESQRLSRHMPIDGKRGAGQRRGPERALVEPGTRIGKAAAIPAQHFHIGEQMVTEGHGLRRLQMRKPRHGQLGVGLGQAG